MSHQQIFAALLTCLFIGSASYSQDLSGYWDAEITCPGGAIRFGLDLKKDASGWRAYLINGPERIEVPQVKIDSASVTLDIDHYDSVVSLKRVPGNRQDRLVGSWKKRRGPDKWSLMDCTAVRHKESETQPPTRFLGRWAVKFEKSDDPAVGIFEQAENSNRVTGTFLTTTGDYRFLDGKVVEDVMELTCFDGAHAFLFRARIDGQHVISGEFWSSSSWHETWTARLDPAAALPDEFTQTRIAQNATWRDLSFPDLDGNLTQLDDPKFGGKARVIYVFGTWCPNCYDETRYLKELHRRYADRGLSILGLAFELGDDPALHRYLLAYASDHAFVTTALQPHGVSWLTPGVRAASLDHAMWFHKPFRVDEWLLYVIDSPVAHGGRGLARGRIFSQNGDLVVSTAQEGVLRRRPPGSGPSKPGP